MKPELSYRPEIDGLRAIAVLAVVLYHAGTPGLSGGFTGVDVFFVISGYLIGRIVISEAMVGEFRLAHFYERRVRRILPALLLVIATTIPFAVLLMTPKAMIEYASSGLANLGFASNFWFWRNVNYYAEPALYMPLLHTWSLAVEEQFYVVFPIVVMLTTRYAPKAMVPLLVIAALASLALAHHMSESAPAAAFYLLPTRAWEMLVGTILAVAELRRGRLAVGWACTAGLILALVPIGLFYEGMRHPSFITAIPVAGAAAIIWFAGGSDVASKALRFTPMVWIGRASYSFYLWHFPVMAFIRIAWPQSGTPHMLAGAALSLVLAFASLYFVETPARRQMPLRRLLAWVAATSIAITVCFAVVLWTDGMRFRIPEPMRSFDVTAERMRMDELQAENMLLEFADNGLPNILILGDSHAHNLWNALFLAGATEGSNIIRMRLDDNCIQAISDPAAFDQRMAADASAPECRQERDTVLSSDNLSKADVVIIINYRSPETTPYLNGAAPGLRQVNAAALYIYADRAMIEFDRPVVEIMTAAHDFSDSPKSRAALSEHRILRNDNAEAIMLSARNDMAGYVNIGAIECGPQYDGCPPYDTDGSLLYYDTHHWTEAGAALHGPRIWQEIKLSAGL